jgi:hypothetical protein
VRKRQGKEGKWRRERYVAMSTYECLNEKGMRKRREIGGER